MSPSNNPYRPPGTDAGAEGSKQPSPGAASRSLIVHGCVAAFLYGVDAFLFSQGAIAGIVTIAMVLLGIVRLVRGVVADRRYIRSGFTIIAIYSMMMAAVVVTIRANNRMARERADEIVVALKRYRSATGDFPVRLEELVPEYMPTVPRAKYTLLFNKFHYHCDPMKHQGSLMYVDVPPFGRPTYRLDTDTWGYLD
ncbi:MAG: hypothetical protein ABI134_17905 [Byssovorax sp.]